MPLLLLQSALAVLTIEVLRRRVWPKLHHTAYPELVIDVWGPIILIMPALFLVGRVDGSVANSWIPIAGPIGVGALGIGAAMMVSPPTEPSPLHQPIRLVSLICWAFVGVFLLLLGAAHELTIGTGQLTFAIAAVMLWMHTPVAVPNHKSQDDPEAAIGRWLMISLALAVGHGWVARSVDPGFAPISGAILMMTGGAALVAAAAQLGPNGATRLAGWAAALGPMFGIGVLSLMNLIPGVIAARDAWTTSIAFGFGRFAPEAVALIVLAALVAMLATRRRTLPAVGIVLILLAATGIAWRLAMSVG